MFSLLKNRTFLIILGLVLLALFIWYAGPYFAFADFHDRFQQLIRSVLFQHDAHRTATNCATMCVGVLHSGQHQHA